MGANRGVILFRGIFPFGKMSVDSLRLSLNALEEALVMFDAGGVVEFRLAVFQTVEEFVKVANCVKSTSERREVQRQELVDLIERVRTALR